MKSIKKRSLNELRQTKEYYKPPISHRAAKERNQIIQFTKTELVDFTYNLVASLMGYESPAPDGIPQLREDVKSRIEKYFIRRKPNV